MRLVSISDLHGKTSKIERLKDAATNAELLVITGDITQFGSRQQAEEILGELLKINKNIIAVPGNCDTEDVNKALIDAGVSVHGEGKVIDGVGFFGVGGSGTTPFGTPQEYTEGKLFNFLEAGYEKIKKQRTKILVAHSPPYGTEVDITGKGHIGSSKIREFIESNEIDLVLCGHAHEARGHDRIGRTLIINPGPLHMGCAIVEIGNKISFELIDL